MFSTFQNFQSNYGLFSPGRSKHLNQSIGHQEADVNPSQVWLGEVEFGLEHDLEEGDRFPEEVA